MYRPCFWWSCKKNFKTYAWENKFIEHNKKGVFQGIPSPLKVTRYHSLIVEKETLPSSLEITALSENNEIMAFQHKGYSLIGVQFHPEAILTEYGYHILSNFLTLKF